MEPLVDQEPPSGWGTDSLTEFMTYAYQNRYATFANKKDWFGRLIGIDACFEKVLRDWTNPTNEISASLFYLCHNSFRAACEHAAAGQVTATFPQLRVCLECAGYALHIHKNDGLDEIWLRRQDDDAAMQAVKSEFRQGNIRATIKSANQHAAKRYDNLYQRTIDFGAHPNEMAMTSNLRIVDQGDRKKLEHLYLQGDSLPLTHALKTTAQVGVCSLEILQEAVAERFELLGVRAEILKLRKGL